MVSVPLWFKTAAWLFHQRSISVHQRSWLLPGIAEPHAKAQRCKGKRAKEGIFRKIYYQERASSVVSVPLCLCGSRRLLGCSISGPV